jgi:ribosomal protein S6E (S10)
MKGIKNMQTITNNTEEVIYGMLTENTGRHMLDSGGSSGRAWQRNALKTLEDFRAEPEAWLDPEWPDVNKSTFWHLVNTLEHDAPLTAAYHAFDDAHPEDSYYETMAAWLDSMGVSETEGDIYGAGRWSFNSYEWEDWLCSQDVQGTKFDINGDGGYVILQVHGGADIRGGYTRPQVFRFDVEAFIMNAQDAYFSCSAEGCKNSLSMRGCYELELEAEEGGGYFKNLEEVKACPCGGSWIN